MLSTAKPMYLSPSRAVGYIFPTYRFFYAIGNTPACDLFFSIPTSVSNCNILSIGCGDIRSVLFSLWQRGRTNKSPTFFMNDHNAAIIAKDIVLLVLTTTAPPSRTASQEPSTTFKKYVANVWALWYSLGLTDSQREMLNALLDQLLHSSVSSEAWRSSKFSQHIDFYDESTLTAVRKVWAFWRRQTLPLALAKWKRDVALQKYLSLTYIAEMGVSVIHSRMVAGISQQEMHQALDEFNNLFASWGVTQAHTLAARDEDVTETNPLLFEASNEYSLHYGAVPYAGYSQHYAFTKDNWKNCKQSLPHLCKDITYTQFVSDAEFSKNFVLANSTQQFCMWIENATKLSTENVPFKVVLKRGDALKFCDELATKGKKFDAIESSNLSDHLGLLPVLICCSEILKENGLLVTNSMTSVEFSANIEEYLATSIQLPLAMLPSTLGLRCVGWEGPMASESSNYMTFPPRFQGGKLSQQRSFVWLKQPLNSPIPLQTSKLSPPFAQALAKLANFCASPVCIRENPAMMDLNAETFVRVLLSLQRHSNIGNWKSLVEALKSDSQLVPYLHGMQTLLNFHKLDINILSFTEVGVHAVVPIKWTDSDQFIPLLYISANNSRHFLDCLEIEYSGEFKVASALHFAIPFPLSKIPDAEVVTELVKVIKKDTVVYRKAFKLAECIAIAQEFSPLVLCLPPVLSQVSQPKFSVELFKEYDLHYDIEVRIPDLIQTHKSALAFVEPPYIVCLRVDEVLGSARIQLQLSSPIDLEASRVTIRKQGIAFVKLIKGKFAFGSSLFHSLDNLLAYPVCEPKVALSLCLMQFQVHKRALDVWSKLKQILVAILESKAKLLYFLVEDRSSYPAFLLVKHETRQCVSNGSIICELSYSTSIEAAQFVSKLSKKLKPETYKVTSDIEKQMRQLLVYNSSCLPSVAAHPDVKELDKYFKRSFLAPLYTPSGDPLDPLMVDNQRALASREPVSRSYYDDSDDDDFLPSMDDMMARLYQAYLADQKSAQAPGNYVCTVCGRPEAKRCTKCKKTAYCSVACQKEDWPRHKPKCK